MSTLKVDNLTTVDGLVTMTVQELRTLLDDGNGVGSPPQTWQDVTGSRVLGTEYSNNTGKPIMVSVTTSGTGDSAVSITVDSVLLGEAKSAPGSFNQRTNCTAIVPNGSTYQAGNLGSSGILSLWSELR